MANLDRSYRSARTSAAPPTTDCSLPRATSRGRYFIPQSGPAISRSGSTYSSAARARPATIRGSLGARPPAEIEDAEDDRLRREPGEHRQVEPRLGGLDRDLVDDGVVELGQEAVLAVLLLHERRVPVTDVEHRRRVDSRERPVDGLDGELPRRLRARLQPGLVDLDDVGARRRRDPAARRSRRRRTRAPAPFRRGSARPGSAATA